MYRINDYMISQIPRYKEFRFRAIHEDILSGNLLCLVQKDSFLEYRRDDHGKLIDVIRNEPEKLEFTIESREFMLGYEPFEVICNRFHAEVDYYLNQKSAPEILESTNTLLRKYRCQCCGTDYITDKCGYTPKCENCGALMISEAFNGIK